MPRVSANRDLARVGSFFIHRVAVVPDVILADVEREKFGWTVKRHANVPVSE